MKHSKHAVELSGLALAASLLIGCQGGLTVEYADEGLSDNSLANPVAADTLHPEADQPHSSSRIRMEVIPPAPQEEQPSSADEVPEPPAE